ncbi:MAG: glycosyltransferase, partial [Chloroflexia bacterium]
MTQPTPQLTIIALTWNEAADLEPCFASLRPLVDRIGARTLVVLDNKADVPTTLAATRVAGKVVQHYFENFARQRNFALDTATSEWVFFIDPDERATPQLCDELSQVMQRADCGAWQ